jgi:tRNA threonylcarbamoyladenosine biosynthesis protein TsaB
MDRSQVRLGDLTAVAISSGPGSFTGLRVGMAAAKGLCRALNLPLIAVPTLEALAASVPPRLQRALPLLPARAREVYWRLFEHDGNRWNPVGDYTVRDVGKVNEVVKGSVFLCGEGYGRHRAELDVLFADRRLELAEPESLEPLVVSAARLAAERYSLEQFDDLIQTEPEYFYPFPRINSGG